ncbi:hypothetical protein HGA88_05555 [Candidatus Roizmanbacteria bacterium]|nr:hypothetical protein [Candidatus Roizmanbacteria bacterium]
MEKTNTERAFRTQHALLAALTLLSAGICAMILVPFITYKGRNSTASQGIVIPSLLVAEATPAVASRSAPSSQGHPINASSAAGFSVQTDRIRLISPIAQQVMSGSTIIFKGQMKNFIEGGMNIRLKNERGELILTDTIQAQSDNYSQFADFQKEVNFVKIPSTAGTHGTWEIYEIAAKDGAEKVLLQIPVQFER